MHCNIASCNAMLLSEKFSYSVISLFLYSTFRVLVFPIKEYEVSCEYNSIIHTCGRLAVKLSS